MLEFPIVPKWWMTGAKHVKLKKPYRPPDYIIGYDTETFKGEIMTQQFCATEYGKKQRKEKIEWVNEDNVLDNFLEFLVNSTSGFVTCYCFNAKFDLSILLRIYIDKFLQDDFVVRHEDKKGRVWEIRVCCSKNWYAFFIRNNHFVYFLDIQNFFSGSLDKVAKAFQCETQKFTRPENLGEIPFYQNDKVFIEYALADSRLCLEIAEKLLEMHEQFDIPVATSSANFAEKVFRRDYIPNGARFQFPSDFPCLRLSELCYHGGKNGYYLDTPAYIHNCYEYDFNSAYPFAMHSLPSFLSGKYEKVNTFKSKYVGVYHVIGNIKPCKFGILYNSRFNYYRFNETVKVQSFCTSFELEEAIKSKEFTIESVKGYIWKPDTGENPLKEYNRYFWERKNSTPKKDIRYIFYKLLLNSLYGKWIQRNPIRESKLVHSNGQINLFRRQDTAGGLYHPFIASLITGHTRARLHTAEHYFNAIESSTDSVKSCKLDTKSSSRHLNEMGVMQLQKQDCKECNKSYQKFNGLFVRNRLNLLMCQKEHIVKCALHGFWGKPEVLLQMFKDKEYVYQVDRMPLIREGIKQIGKNLFQMNNEERSIKDFSWDDLITI